MEKSRISILITVLLWLLTVATAVSIFCFSAEDAKESTETSGKVVRAVAEVAVPEYKNMTPKQQDNFVESVMKYVRKAAHFTIFGFFGLWLYMLLGRYRKSLAFPLAILISLAYACTDELHQRFVSGRTGQLKDVAIDLGGAVVGACIALLLSFIWHKLKNKRANRA